MKKISILLFIIILICVVFALWPIKKLEENKTINRIEIYKSKRELVVFSGETKLKSYKISLGRVPEGKKEFEGDMKTPEGLYTINDKNPNSGYHLNLGVSYPNQDDILNAKELGKPTGGLIKIHGMRNGFGFIGRFHLFFDWTLGCIAVTNQEIEELYENVPIGSEIEIFK